MLCASNGDKSQVELVVPPAGSKIGERITLSTLSDVVGAVPDLGIIYTYTVSNSDPIVDSHGRVYLSEINLKKDGNAWELCHALLKTDSNAVATFGGVAWLTSDGVCKARSIANGLIS